MAVRDGARAPPPLPPAWMPARALIAPALGLVGDTSRRVDGGGAASDGAQRRRARNPSWARLQRGGDDKQPIGSKEKRGGGGVLRSARKAAKIRPSANAENRSASAPACRRRPTLCARDPGSRVPPPCARQTLTTMGTPVVYFDMTIGGAPAGRIEMTLRADVVPKTAEVRRLICARSHDTCLITHSASSPRRPLPAAHALLSSDCPSR